MRRIGHSANWTVRVCLAHALIRTNVLWFGRYENFKLMVISVYASEPNGPNGK